MDVIERAFAEYDLTGPTAQPDGSWRWGTWRIETTPMFWIAIDDTGPADNNGWPLRMKVAADPNELAAWLADEGPYALSEVGYAALQAKADAMIEASRQEVHS